MNNNLVWVLKKSDISKDDLNIIVNLYRPLLGARGQDLYLLMNNIDEEECFDEYGLDYFLNNLEMTEESFIEAKDNLIAYGLLKVWKNSKESKVSLILKKPLSPAGFFANKEWIDFLSLKVGEAQVKKLKNKFIKKVKQQKLLDEISEVINYYDLEKKIANKKI
ncbi:hypothetical protein NPX79_02425 [Spiroplasma endosymbiont of Anurida maritima]|uniref:hypothetical protein n=1 Tax=Spiroplasma endosymbiont of Anurida maritima TaxID=2967972 RepID=UPI0036D41031